MDYRPLQSFKYDCDLEILPYPRTVLVKRLVDKKHHQLAAGSGEEQDLSTSQKTRLKYYKERDGSLINRYGYQDFTITSSAEYFAYMGSLDPAWMRLRVYFPYGSS